LRPANSQGTSGTTRTYDSTMGGNASTGLGSAIVYEIWGVPKLATGKARRLIGSHYFRLTKVTKHFTMAPATHDWSSNTPKTEDSGCLPKTFGLPNSPKMLGAEHVTRLWDQSLNQSTPNRTLGTFSQLKQLVQLETPKRTLHGSTLGAELHGEGVGRIAELGRSLENATREYWRTKDLRTEDQRTENVGERRVGVGSWRKKIRRWCRRDSGDLRILVYRRHTSPNGVGTKEVGSFSGNRKNLFGKPKKPKTFGSRRRTVTTHRSNVMQKRRWST